MTISTPATLRSPLTALPTLPLNPPPTTPPVPLPTTTAAGGAIASTSVVSPALPAMPAVATRSKSDGTALLPKTKPLLSDAAYSQLKEKLRTLEAARTAPERYDAWRAKSGKLLTGSVKDAINKLLISHQSLASFDEPSVLKSIKALYPRMKAAKVALVLDGVVNSISIFSSFASLQAARSIVDAFGENRQGSTEDVFKKLSLIQDVEFKADVCARDVATDDPLFRRLSLAVSNLIASYRLDADLRTRSPVNLRLLRGLLKELEPASNLDANLVLVPRTGGDSTKKKDNKAHRREQRPVSEESTVLSWYSALNVSTTSQSELKMALMDCMLTECSRDDFVGHYGSDAWDAYESVVLALDDDDKSTSFQWLEVVKRANLMQYQRDALITGSMRWRPTFTNLPVLIYEALDLIAEAARDCVRQTRQ